MYNDYTDYLMHSHKYNAKKWIKGKWRYFYDEKLGGKEKRQYEKDRVAHENAKNDLYVKQRTVIKSKNPSDAYSKENLAYRKSAGKYLKTYDDLSNSKYAYENTSLAKIDKAKSKAKAKIEKIFEKQIAEADAKKTAKQRKAREEGMAAEAKAKAEKQQQAKLASDKRAVEKEQIKTLNALKKDRREHGYAESEKQKQDANNRKRIDDRVDKLENKSNKLRGERYKDVFSYTAANLNAKYNNRAMTPEEMNDYIRYYNSAKEKTKVINDVDEKARIATHIKTIMDKTDGDVPEYLNKMLNDPYSASEEFWETLADNIQKPKRKNK